MTIKEILSSQNAYGEGHALTSHRLAELTGMSEREIRRAVYRERQGECHTIGDFICSTPNGNGGYYLAATLDDVRKVLKRQEGMSKKHFQSVKNMRHFIKAEEQAQASTPLFEGNTTDTRQEGGLDGKKEQ